MVRSAREGRRRKYSRDERSSRFNTSCSAFRCSSGTETDRAFTRGPRGRGHIRAASTHVQNPQVSPDRPLLFARLIYNDGLVTVFAFGIYAANTFSFTSAVLEFGIVINVAAVVGAVSLGFLMTRSGRERS
jgi:hypothetical protein